MDAVAADYAVVGGIGAGDHSEPMTKRNKLLLSAFLSGCATAFVLLAICAISSISGNYTYLRTKQTDPHQSTKSPLSPSREPDSSFSSTAKDVGDFRETEEAMERLRSYPKREGAGSLPPKPPLEGDPQGGTRGVSVVSPDLVRQGVPEEHKGQKINVEEQKINVEPVSVNAGDGPRL